MWHCRRIPFPFSSANLMIAEWEISVGGVWSFSCYTFYSSDWMSLPFLFWSTLAGVNWTLTELFFFLQLGGWLMAGSFVLCVYYLFFAYTLDQAWMEVEWWGGDKTAECKKILNTIFMSSNNYWTRDPLPYRDFWALGS